MYFARYSEDTYSFRPNIYNFYKKHSQYTVVQQFQLYNLFSCIDNCNEFVNLILRKWPR